MPNVSITLPNVSQSIARPVIFDVAQQILAVTKIDPSTPIFYLDDQGNSITPGTTIGSADRRARFGAEKRVIMEVEDRRNLDNLATSSFSNDEYPSILEDRAIGWFIKPIFQSRDIRINFVYRTNSKQEAQRWQDDISMRISALREMFLHRVQYHYGLPQPTWDLLKELHAKRELKAGYGESFEAYIERLGQGRLTWVGEGTGGQRKQVVTHRQGRIVGLFDFDAEPEKSEYQDDKGVWHITVAYKFTYDMAVGVNMVYPFMVHNSPLADKFITPTHTTPYDTQDPKEFSQTGWAYEHFSQPALDMRYDEEYARIPHFDDYKLPVTFAGTGTALLVMLQLEDTQQSQVLMNLKKLGDLIFHPDLLDFLEKVEYQYTHLLYKSIFHFGILKNGMLGDPDRVRTDAQLNLRTSMPLKLRDTYRMRLALVTDLQLLDPEAIRRLSLYPKAFVAYFQALNILLRNRRDFERIGDQRYVSQKQINAILALINANGAGQDWPHCQRDSDLFKDLGWDLIQRWKNSLPRRMTVMTTGIVARRRLS